MELEHHKQFHRYHRVLSHTSWSSLAPNRALLGLLVELFVSDGPPVVGIDETLQLEQLLFEPVEVGFLVPPEA